jgi:hypothetical protein
MYEQSVGKAVWLITITLKELCVFNAAICSVHNTV